MSSIVFKNMIIQCLHNVTIKRNALIAWNASCAAEADANFAGKEITRELRLNLGHA